MPLLFLWKRWSISSARSSVALAIHAVDWISLISRLSLSSTLLISLSTAVVLSLIFCRSCLMKPTSSFRPPKWSFSVFTEAALRMSARVGCSAFWSPSSVSEGVCSGNWEGPCVGFSSPSSAWKFAGVASRSSSVPGLPCWIVSGHNTKCL